MPTDLVECCDGRRVRVGARPVQGSLDAHLAGGRQVRLLGAKNAPVEHAVDEDFRRVDVRGFEVLGKDLPLAGQLKDGVEVVDFFHAVVHLSAALGAAYGDGSTEARARLVELRHRLAEQDDGAERVISALAYLANKHPRSLHIKRALEYFSANTGIA